MVKNPAISIIIPTYNRAYTIGRTIDSFLLQDYNNWEMLVVDDYSTDNTREIIEDFIAKDSRVHYLLNERKKGAQGARNTGILHSNADWIIIFDSDDYAYPAFIKRMVKKIDDKVDVITCYARQVDVNENIANILKWGGEGNIEKDLLDSRTYVNFDDCIFRKKKITEIGLLDEDCPAYQEYDTHIRLSRICNYAWVKEVLLDYMWGGADTMSVNQKNNGKGLRYVLWKNRERWKEIAYQSYHDMLLKQFRHAPLRDKYLFVKSDYKLLLDIPNLYYQVGKRYIKRIQKLCQKSDLC